MRSLLFILLLAASSAAQFDGNPQNWCREGFFTRDTDEFRIGTVTSNKASFFKDDIERCPEGRNCAQEAYLIKGNEVLVGRSYEGFACAWYSPKKGPPTVGWIREANLSFPVPLPMIASLSAWEGEWTHGDNGIDFAKGDRESTLNVSGNATWIGLNDNVHVGEIEGTYSPRESVIEYSDGNREYDCRMTIRLLGNYLIVADNLKCGGVNVSFSGVYSKKLAK